MVRINLLLLNLDGSYQPLHSCSSANELAELCKNDSFYENQIAAAPPQKSPDDSKAEGDEHQSMVEVIENETAIWDTLHHPNIIPLLNVLEVEDQVFVVFMLYFNIEDI